jgi:hypothetical protein
MPAGVPIAMPKFTTKAGGGKGIRPDKPYGGFRLFPHASGYWANKVRRRLVYFGNK